MIYEIFKTAADAGFTWWHYAGAVLGSAYAVYIMCWLVGWLYSWSYSFVFEGKKTTPNFMIKFIQWLGGGWLPDGWYASKDIGASTYWRYRKYSGGLEIDCSDRLKNTLTPPQLGKPVLFFGSWNPISVGLFSPLVFTTLFLFADLFPTIAVTIILYYGVLLMARKAVKIAEKINAHMEDKSIHKTEE